MNRTATRLLTIPVAMSAALGVIGPASAATDPYCGITWGSGAETDDVPALSTVLDVRAGRHACFDRLVVDLGGRDLTFRSFDVRYVPVVQQDGSGHPLPVRGAADLQIQLGAPGYDVESGAATYEPDDAQEAVAVAGYSTFRQVVWGGSYEGQSLIALGVRARLPFRVFTLPALPGSEQGPRLVVDVAHRW